jgi:hypothetical protein
MMADVISLSLGGAVLVVVIILLIIFLVGRDRRY